MSLERLLITISQRNNRFASIEVIALLVKLSVFNFLL